MSGENKTDKADKTTTYAVKIDESTKKEILELINESGEERAGDFFKLLVESYKTNKLTSGEHETQADIKELNQLTSRMYSLYNNLIERNNTNISNIEGTLLDQLKQKDEEASKLEYEIDKLKILEKSSREYTTHITKEKEILDLKVTELEEKLSDKNKLSGMLEEEVEDLKQYKSNAKVLEEENKVLENDLNTLKNGNMQLESTILANKQEIENLNNRIIDTENKHKEEIESMKTKLELQFQQQILKLQQDHQVQLQEIQNQKMKDVSEYQDRYNKLLDKSDAEKEELQNQIKKLQSR